MHPGVGFRFDLFPWDKIVRIGVVFIGTPFQLSHLDFRQERWPFRKHTGPEVMGQCHAFVSGESIQAERFDSRRHVTPSFGLCFHSYNLPIIRNRANPRQRISGDAKSLNSVRPSAHLRAANKKDSIVMFSQPPASGP